MLKAKWVDVVDIVSDIPRSNFSEEDIETLANKILQADGLLVPLLLEKRDIATYTVISGHLEYYAAVRAKEIDLRSAEMVNAFILPDENKEQALAQIKQLKSQSQLSEKKVKPIEINLEPSLLAELNEGKIQIHIDIKPTVEVQKQSITKEYNQMNVRQLKDLAKERGITRYSKLRRQQLVELHQNWDQQ